MRPSGPLNSLRNLNVKSSTRYVCRVTWITGYVPGILFQILSCDFKSSYSINSGEKYYPHIQKKRKDDLTFFFFEGGDIMSSWKSYLKSTHHKYISNQLLLHQIWFLAIEICILIIITTYISPFLALQKNVFQKTKKFTEIKYLL